MLTILQVIACLAGLGMSMSLPNDRNRTSIEQTYPQPNNCSFYPDCLEARFHCGPEGYPLAEGYRYCSKALAVRDRLSPAGQQWVTDTMLCLQNKLVPVVTDKTPMTCTALGDYALSTHPDCYVQNGWCDLPLRDWTTIVEVVWPSFFADWRSVKEVFEVVVDCALIHTF